MVSVRRDDGVSPGYRRLHPDGDGFLAVVEVAEPADEFGLVERVGGDLHPPHQGHVAEEGEELRRRGLDGARGGFDEVGCEWERGFDCYWCGVCGDVAAEGGGEGGGEWLEEGGGSGGES